MMRYFGDPEEVLDWKQTDFDPVVAEVALRRGRVLHVVLRCEDGLLALNFWRSEAERREAGREVHELAQFADVVEARNREHPEGTAYPSAEPYRVVDVITEQDLVARLDKGPGRSER
jgi:hypothetical protein